MNSVKYTLALLPTIIGNGALAVFTVFLFTGPFHIIELSLGITGGLVFDACLCFAFFLQHSVMIRKGIKSRIVQRIPRRYFSALYAIAASGILFVFVSVWQESSLLIASAEGVYRRLLQGVFFLAVVGQIWISRSLEESVDVFGAKALMQPVDAAPPPPAPIVLVGAYAWVRHPAYFTMLLLIWTYPDLTADRLLLNVLFTVWILVGALLEERDLVAVYGEDYRGYQRAVPMLIPYKLPVRAVENS